MAKKGVVIKDKKFQKEIKVLQDERHFFKERFMPEGKTGCRIVNRVSMKAWDFLVRRSPY